MPTEQAAGAATTSAPATTTVATGGGAGSSPKAGIFDGMAIKEPKAASTEGAEGDAGDGQEGASADGGAATGEGGDGGEPATTAPPKLLAGRFKTPEELENAYGESSKEGYRLYQELRSVRDEIKTREERIAALETELKEARTQPVFQELTQEQLKALAAEDPLKAAEYVAEKKFREREAVAAKKQREEQTAAQKREAARVQNAIKERHEQMEADPQAYPDYGALQPIMSELLDKTENALAGHTWTPDILYYAALGLKHISAHRKGKEASAASTEEAKKKAAAAAKAGSAGGGAAPKPPAGSSDDDDINARLIKAAPKKLFAGV